MSQVVQTYYIPLADDHLQDAFVAMNTGGAGVGLSIGNNVSTTISISVKFDNTIIYYDQWENGYENDIGNPSDVYSVSNTDGTQIWGDGNTANGFPPGVGSDLLSEGDVITLENDVPANPRNSSNIYFDGKDKLGSNSQIIISRAGYSSQGSVQRRSRRDL